MGRVGDDLTVEQGRAAARDCMLNLLAQTRDALGSLDRIAQVVKVLGFVACTADFRDAPRSSTAPRTCWPTSSATAARHARLGHRRAALPLGFAVEVEMVVEFHRP